MERYNRKTVFSPDLFNHCLFAAASDFIEVTEWANNEGFDVNISNKSMGGSRVLSFTYGEFDLLRKMIKKGFK